jgi:hypothetical protein
MSDFSKQIKAWTEKAKGNMEKVAQLTCSELSEKVVMRTPVDTGRLRGNWQPSINRIPNSSLLRTDKSGINTLSRISASVKKLKTGDTFYLINNLVYAQVVEYGLYPKLVKYRTHQRNLKDPKYGRMRSWNGFSTLAPNGMVRVSINEFNQVVRKAVKVIG